MADLNTHIFSWNGPFGLPQFDKIAHEDYDTAFEQALVLDLSPHHYSFIS